jgi:hypothetical protein
VFCQFLFIRVTGAHQTSISLAKEGLKPHLPHVRQLVVRWVAPQLLHPA